MIYTLQFTSWLLIQVVCHICNALITFFSALNLQADVAGATFMAAGSSAPELFTSIIGRCIWMIAIRISFINTVQPGSINLHICQFCEGDSGPGA